MELYTDLEPVFSEYIEIVDPTDPAHADNINMASKQLLANTQFNKDAIEALKSSTGNTSDMAYKTDGIYKVGDYCIYNNRLYKCISAIEVAEEWNKAHWEETTMTKELVFLANKEVEVVDPTTATEAGFAADAKLTGDALQALRTDLANLRTALAKKADASALAAKANTSALGTQCTFSLSGTTLTITPK